MNLQLVVIVAILILGIDLVWIGYIAKPLFSKTVQRIQGQPLKFNPVGAVIAYLIMIVGTYFLVAERARTPKEAAMTGAILGLVMYGVFDFTNMAIFRNWDWKTTIIDVTWGTFLMATVGYLSIMIKQRLRLN